MAAGEASERDKGGGNGFIKTIPVALVALDRNPVYRIMSVCPPMHVPVHVRVYIRTATCSYVHTCAALVPVRVLKVLAHRAPYNEPRD